MALLDLDHVNIRTVRLDAMSRFYEDILGLKVGPRPPFSFNGTWLYCGDKAAIHLVEIASEGHTANSPDSRLSGIEHFAFNAEGLDAFLARLEGQEIGFELRTVPEFGTRQVHFRDPDGNHIEVAFAPAD